MYEKPSLYNLLLHITSVVCATDAGNSRAAESQTRQKDVRQRKRFADVTGSSGQRCARRRRGRGGHGLIVVIIVIESSGRCPLDVGRIAAAAILADARRCWCRQRTRTVRLCPRCGSSSAAVGRTPVFYGEARRHADWHGVDAAGVCRGRRRWRRGRGARPGGVGVGTDAADDGSDGRRPRDPGAGDRPAPRAPHARSTGRQPAAAAGR